MLNRLLCWKLFRYLWRSEKEYAKMESNTQTKGRWLPFWIGKMAGFYQTFPGVGKEFDWGLCIQSVSELIWHAGKVKMSRKCSVVSFRNTECILFQKVPTFQIPPNFFLILPDILCLRHIPFSNHSSECLSSRFLYMNVIF